MTATIVATGTYIPKRVLSNADLEKMVETNDEWIVTRTGIRERRIAAEDEHTSTMGARAALQALERAGMAPEEIDLILVATSSPDYLFPSTAALIQKEIGAKNGAAFDFQAACGGFIYGLSIAKGVVEAGVHKNVLLICSEKLSAFIDYTDRSTCILFGDGAAAVVVRKGGAGLAIEGVKTSADGEQADLVCIPAGGSRRAPCAETVSACQHYIQMEGRETFKHAVRGMAAACEECLASLQLDKGAVDWLIPHQANIRIIEACAKRLELPMEQVYLTVHKYGNTSASSVPIALHELLEEHGVEGGKRILTCAFGAGSVMGAAMLLRVTA
ncbi:MAG: beta-ketoacyl-ACP synthase III [Parachlamydiales bacterium]